MNTSLKELIVFDAWRHLLDPGTPPNDLTAAEVVLRASTDRLLQRMEDSPIPVVELAPDRMARLLSILPHLEGSRPSPQLDAALHEALHCAIADGMALSLLLSTRRAHAILELLSRLGFAVKIDADELLWIFSQDEYAAPALYPFLDAWCEAHDPLPPAVVDLVVELRADEEDSPILDRLAAWVAPSKEGMLDLAMWERAYRGCRDPEWHAAVSRWERGEPVSDLDAPVLRIVIDHSGNSDAVRMAAARDAGRTLEALGAALQEVHDQPILRVLLSTWTNVVRGSR